MNNIVDVVLNGDIIEYVTLGFLDYDELRDNVSSIFRLCNNYEHLDYIMKYLMSRRDDISIMNAMLSSRHYFSKYTVWNMSVEYLPLVLEGKIFISSSIISELSDDIIMTITSDNVDGLSTNIHNAYEKNRRLARSLIHYVTQDDTDDKIYRYYSDGVVILPNEHYPDVTYRLAVIMYDTYGILIYSKNSISRVVIENVDQLMDYIRMGYSIPVNLSILCRSHDQLEICHPYLSPKYLGKSIMYVGMINGINITSVRISIDIKTDEELILYMKNVFSIPNNPYTINMKYDMDSYERLDILYKLGHKPNYIHDWIRLLNYEDVEIDVIRTSDVILDRTYIVGLKRLWSRTYNTNSIVVNHYMRYYKHLIPILYPRLDGKFSKFITYSYPVVNRHEMLSDVLLVCN